MYICVYVYIQIGIIQTNQTVYHGASLYVHTHTISVVYAHMHRRGFFACIYTHGISTHVSPHVRVRQILSAVRLHMNASMHVLMYVLLSTHV